MSVAIPKKSQGTGSAQIFATTHWSVVLAARKEGGLEVAEALEKLCRTYWYPLYAYLRRRGYAEHDAQDLTQGFFSHLLEQQSLQGVAREKGKFRSFLLACLKYYLAHERERASAQKRGGGQQIFSLDSDEAEQRYRREPADDRSPEKIYEYRWAIALLDQVLVQLAIEFDKAGKEALFEKLRPFLVDGKGSGTCAHAAVEMEMSEAAFKKSVQRMRQRYGELFRSEIARTVSDDPGEIEEELRYLSAVLSR